MVAAAPAQNGVSVSADRRVIRFSDLPKTQTGLPTLESAAGLTLIVVQVESTESKRSRYTLVTDEGARYSCPAMVARPIMAATMGGAAVQISIDVSDSGDLILT